MAIKVTVKKDLIRSAMKARRVSYTKLADACGWSPTTMERCIVEAKMTPEMMCAISDYLNIDSRELCTDE